nr:hypothetical protein [uncultured Rhodopila sp.]
MAGDIDQKLTEIEAGIGALTAALRMQQQALGHHGSMLADILAAVTANEGDSPLVEALRALVVMSERSAEGIERIEAALAARGSAGG